MTHRRFSLLFALILFFPSLALAQEDKQSLDEQLWEAARKGDVSAVKSLLDKGADVNAKFRYGTTALFKAAERGHAEVAKLLLERGADATVRDTFYRATALYWALDKGHVGVVRAILERDAASVDEVLMSGARRANTEMLRAAVERGGARADTLTLALALVSSENEENKDELTKMLKDAGAQPPPEVEAAKLQAFAGKYRSEQGMEIVLAAKDGRLTGGPTGQRPLNLIPVGKDMFRPLEFDGIIVTFDMEGDKATGFTFKQGPNTTLLKKVE